MTAVIEELQRQYNATVMAWEVERVIHVLRHREGNSAGERTSLDRMKALGAVANDLLRKIGEKHLERRLQTPEHKALSGTFPLRHPA